LKRRFQFFGISVEPAEQHLLDDLDHLEVDHAAQADLLAVVDGHVDRHLVVEDPDGQVLALLPEHDLDLLLLDRPRTVMRDTRPCRRHRTRLEPSRRPVWICA
jgi:hypothetical protein